MLGLSANLFYSGYVLQIPVAMRDQDDRQMANFPRFTTILDVLANLNDKEKKDLNKKLTWTCP